MFNLLLLSNKFSLSFYSLFMCSVSMLPLFFSLMLLFVMVLIVKSFYFSGYMSLLFSILVVLFLFVFFGISWLSDIDFENSCGSHCFNLNNSFKFGVMLFILSEGFLFFSFFWSFFHQIWFSGLEIVSWPPVQVLDMVLDAFSIPFLKSILLVSSGFSMTLFHHMVLNKVFNNISWLLSILFGFSFVIMQFFEYCGCYYSVCGYIFGSMFFMLTGFHGCHVLMGMSLLCVWNFYNISKIKHSNLMYSIWYWHFVDVVWLYLFILLYWYGG